MSSTAILSPQTVPSASAYAGLNLYERTDVSVAIVPSAKTKSSSKFFISNNPQPLIESRSELIQQPRLQTRQIAKTIPKEVAKETSKIIPREIVREQTKQTTKLIPKLITRFTVKVPPTPPKIPPVPPKIKARTRFGVPFPKFKGSSFGNFFGKFNVFGRRFGKFKPIGIATSTEKALKIGTNFAGKTLGATFKITGKGLKLPKIIPGYRIKQTKQGTLFIEQRRYRLNTPTEKREIKSYKRRKRK